MTIKLIKCHNPKCEVKINVDSAFTIIGGRYAGSLWAHAWYCRHCDEMLINGICKEMKK